MRVALVHDWLVTLGGADRVLLALHALFPQAPVYTTVFDPSRLPGAFAALDVRPSWLQRIPRRDGWHRWLVPLMPLAVRAFDLRGYDLVISSSHACAKGIAVPPGATHICYCYTPMRYAWDQRDAYLASFPPALHPAARAALGWLRRWDAATAASVHHFVAISRFVAERIRSFYGRPAAVIYPPVDTDFFTPGGPPEDFFLMAGRLVPYKRFDLAVEAATRLRRRLVVVGDGPERARLQALAGPTVEFVGEVPDSVLRDYYRRCRALIFPGIEDFGLVPVEAQACGRPVLAYARGGALETVREGATGLFFRAQTPDAVGEAMRAVERVAFDPATIRRHAERFSTRAFSAQLTAFVAACLAEDR
ncbi:MAG TPA: glycosyltransferase [bacterium]|nr:glycosyltransferase [bacterium]